MEMDILNRGTDYFSKSPFCLCVMLQKNNTTFIYDLYPTNSTTRHFIFFHFIFLQVVIEGIRGKDYKGDIAIDDIDIKDGLCPPPGKYTYHYITSCYTSFNIRRVIYVV